MSEYYVPEDHVPLPPPDAKVHTTACDYCVVACGYRAYVWPIGREGGPKAGQNALGVDFPVGTYGPWISPNMHNVVMVDGRPHHLVVMADWQTRVVNPTGNHSMRGGTLAQKCYNPQRPTADRLKHPMIRVRGGLHPVSWDLVLDVMADVSKYVIEKYGEHAWGMKTYSYAYFENTYAVSKLAFEDIGTPSYAPHDKPVNAEDVPGLDWSGIEPFSASYEDFSACDVLFISGTDPYETKTVMFTQWIMGGNTNKKLIFALPRRTMGVAWAEANGGLFLQVVPGTDTLLHMAIARVILENGWEDQEWLASHLSSKLEIDWGMGRGPRNTPVEWLTTWGKYGTDLEGYKKWLLENKWSQTAVAAEITGVPVEKIRLAAKMIAQPLGDGRRPRASFMLEKGNYWSNNFGNTASFAALGLLCGAGTRPGSVISRGGGHQRGWASNAAPYPRIKGPEKLPGRRKKNLDVDRWVADGHVKFMWVIGTTWVHAMSGSQDLTDRLYGATRHSPHQVVSLKRDEIVETLRRRVDEGGMVLAAQDIYLVDPLASQLADFVLPAAGWGEADYTRCNGERRLRLYSKLYDPPGEAKPDWWVISSFAKRMGFEGYDWKTSSDVFEEAARFSRGGALNYYPLVWYAKKMGLTGHDLLRKLGTHGIQTPVRFVTEPTVDKDYLAYAGSFKSDAVPGMILGTMRLHDENLYLGTPEGPTTHAKWLSAFKTHTGKAILLKSPWEDFKDFYDRIQPGDGELWITNGRVNELWQSGYDDFRQPFKVQRWPSNFVEIHPEDARARGIESGDQVAIESDDVLVQTGGFLGVQDGDLGFSWLVGEGHIQQTSARATAVAIVTPAVKPGVAFMYFVWPGSAANSFSHRVPDPISNNYRYKLGKGRVRKIGESIYKHSLDAMTFVRRDIV